MNLLRQLSICIFLVATVMLSACTASKRFDTIQYTNFDKLDKLHDNKIEFPGKKIVVDSLTVRPNNEEPAQFNDYVWVLKTSISHEAVDQYKHLNQQQKYQVGFRNLPIKDVSAFFREAADKNLQAAGDIQENIAIDIKKISLVTSNIGQEKYRACQLTIGITSQGKVVESSSEIKMQDSYTKFYKGDSYSSKSYYFDPVGLDVVELTFVDALQQGLSQLILK